MDATELKETLARLNYEADHAIAADDSETYHALVDEMISLQDDYINRVKRGDHIIVTDEDGDESKWLVVWEHEHCVLACEIKLDFYSENFAAVNNIPRAFESHIDLKNAQEFTVDGTTVRKQGAVQ